MTATLFRTISTSKRNDVLKSIAILSMIIDHVGLTFFPDLLIFRTIGRIAFPIFAYQLVKGYKHTSNLSKYAGRLFLFALISYLPYIYFVGNNLTPNPRALNVMFLLLAGIGALMLFDGAKDSFFRYKKSRQIGQLLIGIFCSLLLVIYVLIPELLTISIPDFKFSYGTYGLLMILSFYAYEGKTLPLLLSFVFITGFTTYLKGLRYTVLGLPNSMLLSQYINSIKNQSMFIIDHILHHENDLKTLQGYFFQARSIIAYGFIISLEKKQFNFTLNKYIAYWFYPVHISVILIIFYLINYV